MLTFKRYSGSGSVGHDAHRVRGAPLTLLTVLALVVTACGGGGGGATTTSTASGQPPPVSTASGSVVVRTTTSSGVPVSGAGVALSGSFYGRTATTDANGEARFSDVPAGPVRAQAKPPGYYTAYQNFILSSGAVTSVTLILEDVTEATPVMLGTHAVASGDGRTLTVDLDLAVLDANGAGRELSSSDDIALDGGCDWGGCVTDAAGRGTSDAYAARIDSVTPQPVPTQSRPALATAVLLDESAGTATFDPSGQRLTGVKTFLAAVSPPDTATVATFRSEAAVPALQVLGEFTSDATTFAPAVEALAGRESGPGPGLTLSALTSLVQYVKEHTVSGADGPQRSIVVVNGSYSGDYGCLIGTPCQDAAQDSLGAALAAGIHLSGIGDGWAIPWIAARTGGISVSVWYPSQLPVVLRSLNSLIVRDVAFNRVRIVLESSDGVFTPGRAVWGYLSFKIGPNTRLGCFIAVPI